jgi:hypothetical protein
MGVKISADMNTAHLGELLDFQIYDKSHGPQQNVERVAHTLGHLRQFLVRDPEIFSAAFGCHDFGDIFLLNREESLTIDLFRVDIRNKFIPRRDIEWFDNLRAVESPLLRQAFVKSLNRPPGTKIVRTRTPRCSYTSTKSPIKHCFCTLTPQDYVRPPVTGEVLEQLCIVQWQSQKERRKVKKKNRNWWDNTFVTQINQAVQDEKVSFVEHWTIEFDKWKSGHQPVETSSNLGRCLRKLAMYMSF